MDNCTTPLKRCTKCEREFPATSEFFHRNKNKRDGLQYVCKFCRKTGNPRPIARLGMKYCTQCGNEFPATWEFFYRHKDRRDGLSSNCKSCHDEKVRQYRVLNPEKARAINRKTYLAKRIKHCAQAAQWRKAHPHKLREYRLRRRALEAQVTHTFTARHERMALDYFNDCCAVCGRQFKDLFSTHRLEWDHWIPVSKGGNTTLDNMIPLCGGTDGCNTQKSASLADEWLKLKFGARKANKILASINAYFELARSWVSD